MSVKIFFCYAQEDKALLKELQSCLVWLQRQKMINWYDISIGDECDQRIKESVDTAHVILPLVSQYSLNSDYFFSTEMQQVMERHRNGETQVIPIILRPVYYQRTPLAKLQVLPSDGRPVVTWPDLNQALSNVAKGIQTAAMEVQWLNEIDDLYRAGRYVEVLLACEKIPMLATVHSKIKAWHRKGLVLRALKRHEEALVVFDKILTLDSTNAQAWYDRGSTLSVLGRYQKAVNAFEHAERSVSDITGMRHNNVCVPHSSEQQLGTDHPQTATSLNNLAELYRDQGKYDEAEPLYVRALAISEQQLGVDHPSTATSLNNLAELYRDQGKYDEAEPLYQRALAIFEQQLETNHPLTITTLNNLAGLYYHQGEYSKAKPLYVRALEIRERLLGTEHPDTATSLNNLASLCHHQGKYHEAEPLFIRALKIREQQLGMDHPQTAGSLNNLAELYRDQKKYSEAEPLYVRALAISERQLGADHPQTAGSLNNLALLYRDQGKYSEAEPLYQRALQISEQQLGADHPTTQTIRTNYQTLVQRRERGN